LINKYLTAFRLCTDHHRRSSHREEEPEWFSGGPVSKSDTIELHGFERRDSENKQEGRGRNEGKELRERDRGNMSDEEKEQEGEGTGHFSIIVEGLFCHVSEEESY